MTPLEIQFVQLDSRTDQKLEAGMTCWSWDEFVESFSEHEVQARKDGLCFMPVAMKPVETWELSKPKPGAAHKPGFRNDGNVAAVSLIVLDLDRPGAREKAQAAFADNEYLLYSTYSYSQQAPYKFRLVLALDKPICVADWPDIFAMLAQKVDADISCSNVSRIYYTPAVNPDADITPVAVHNQGVVLQRDLLIKQSKRWALEAPAAKRSRTRTRRTRPPSPEHFAGVTNQPNPANYRISALIRRHSSSIVQLQQDDSRHYFAMTVLAREIAKYGVKTDVEKLVQFIAYSASRYSSRSIDSGNTVEELPELFISAWNKYSPDNSIDSNVILRAVNDSIDIALDAEDNDDWTIDGLPRKTPLIEVHTTHESADPVSNAKQIAYEGVNQNKNVSVFDIALNCLKDTPSEFLEHVTEVLKESSADIFPANGRWNEEQFQRFWPGALARAKHHLTNEGPTPGL